MSQKLVVAFILLSAVAVPSFGDNTATIVGAGYTPAVPIVVAPGQIVTVFVTGFASFATPVSATTVPLPYKLSGISAVLLPGPVPVPILNVSSVNTCLFNVPVPGLSCGTVTGVTVQIPFELELNTGSEAPPAVSYLTISDDSGHSGSVRVLSEYDQIHVVGTGNFIVPAVNGVVTHADGTAVDSIHPAKPGEEVVMYAFGLGKYTPAVITGAASPSPAASTTEGFRLNFDYRPNATASPGTVLYNSSSAPTPLFAGLTPGFVGLYQINFVVPAPAGPLSPCVSAGSVGSGVSPFVAVWSNLTVTLVGAVSFDGAAICVAAAP